MSNQIDGEFSCPVCFEIPPDKIYQCLNGHIICSTCSINLTECPQCREPYGIKKSRNRALEEILNSRQFNCPNAFFRCTQTIFRRELQFHLRNCAFQGKTAKICQRMGYCCDYETSSKNVEDATLHFQTEHGAVKLKTFYGKIQLVNCITPGTDVLSTGVYTPYIFEKDDYQFLFFAKIHGESETVSFNCIQLDDSSHLQTNFIIKIRVSSPQNHFVEHTSTPIQLSEVDSILLTPPLQLSGTLLKEKYLLEHNLQFILQILTDDEVSSIPPSINKSDTFFAIQSKLDMANTRNPENNVTWPIVQCDNCSMKPIVGALHHCLQCADFALCDPCMEKKAHSHHLFTAVKSKRHFVVLKKWCWSRNQDKFLPLIPEFEGSLICINCQMKGRERNASFVCVDCPQLKCYCENCSRSVIARPQCPRHTLIRFWRE